VPINNAYGNINLNSVDSMIAFIPHNGVLYVWYRLGILGEITLWSIVGFGILAGCRLAKHGNRETAAFGAIAVCAIICYVLQGYNDLGFDWLRIVIFIGFMLGALEATCHRIGHPRRALLAPIDRST
jgi:O-antigen ligase